MVGTLPSKAGVGSILDQEARTPRALRPKKKKKNQNIKQKQYCNKFNNEFKNGSHKKIFKKNGISHSNTSKAVLTVT